MPDQHATLGVIAKAKSESATRTFKVCVDGTSYQVQVEEVLTPEPRHMLKSSAAVGPKPIAIAKAPAVHGDSGGNGSAKNTPLVAPMPGVVVRHEKVVGDDVQVGDVVLILEAMKMQNSLLAPASGKLVSTHCEQGQMVRKGAVLAVIA